MKQRYDPREVLHGLCNNYEIPAVDDPVKSLTRVQLTTQTYTVNTAFRFDSDKRGFQHYTPLGRIEESKRSKFAEVAMRNPSRELTPVLNSEGIAGIQGAKSDLPNTKSGIERALIDTFGRIANYVDNEFPKLINEVNKNTK